MPWEDRRYNQALQNIYSITFMKILDFIFPRNFRFAYKLNIMYRVLIYPISTINASDSYTHTHTVSLIINFL